MAPRCGIARVDRAQSSRRTYQSLRAATRKAIRAQTTLIIEFGDFACPACAAFARETTAEIEREWIMTGRARLQFIPIDVFRTGRLAARAAECAAEQDAFWPMHDLLYARQKEWLGRGGQRCATICGFRGRTRGR
jgi:hypothetical protein